MNRNFLSIIISFVFFQTICVAAEYYVDAENGDNQSGDGSLNNPWQTIQHAADTMNEGDLCIIREGVYRETVIPKHNQTFQSFEGEYVLITGCDIVTDWTLHNGNIYKTSVETEVRAVFVEGVHMYKARHPNENGNRLTSNEWYFVKNTNTSTAGTGTASVDFYRGQINSPEGHWVGGYYIGLVGSNHYNSNMGRITASNGTELTITDLNFQLKRGQIHFQDVAGRGYIIHHLNALDMPWEWHWQNDTLYLWEPDGQDPDQKVVEAQVRLWGFDLAASNNVTIEGLNFKAASVKTGGDGMDGSEGNIIDGCTFRYHAPFGKHYYSQYYHNNGAGAEYYAAGGTIDGTSGITLTGSNNTIKNCYIGHAWGLGVRVFGNNNTVHNCFIEDVNWLTRFSMGPIRIAGNDHTITNNTVQHTPGAGIRGYEIDINSVNNVVRRCNISYNIVRDYGHLMHDSETAGIYFQNHNVLGPERWLDGIVSYNIIYGNQTNAYRVSCGIYFDNGTDDCDIHHNVIHANGKKMGIFFNVAGHSVDNINLWHNTIWDHNEEAIAIENGPFTECVTQNNMASGEYFAGTTVSNNRENVPDEELYSVDSEFFDFRIADSLSASIDAGLVISGINDGYDGAAPDLGAYEYGAAAWQAGSTVVPREDWPDEGEPTLISQSSRRTPEAFKLLQNYPNPFNPATTISYQLPVTSYTQLSIYNVLGQKIATLVNENQAAGSYQVTWDASGFAAGVYFYRIKSGGYEDFRKMALIK